MAAGRRLVMVVDDDDGICDAIGGILEDTGYDVVISHNGLEALSFLRGTNPRPCMILLDLMMPVMDGLAFRRHQLEDPAIAQIPVVIVTAGSAPISPLAGDEVMRKPVELTTLLSVVAEHCSSQERPT